MRVFGFVFFLSWVSLSLRGITLLHRNACMSILSEWVGEKKCLRDGDRGRKEMIPSLEESLYVLLFCELSFRRSEKSCH